MSERVRCDRTVAINFPCALSNGHDGVCQADPEGQLRLYGIAVEDLREIQRDLYDAQRLGLITGSGARTSFGRYVRLRASLDRALPRGDQSALVRASDIYHAIDRAEQA